MTVPATATGTLYGGIGESAIVSFLASRGFRVDSSWVQLAQPIKETGEHAIRLQLPHGLEAEVTIIVTSDT